MSVPLCWSPRRPALAPRCQRNIADCEARDGMYYRCREATSEGYQHIRRDRIKLSEEGDCRIIAVTPTAKGHRLRVYCPRAYSRTHPNMLICGSTPAAACTSTSSCV